MRVLMLVLVLHVLLAFTRAAPTSALQKLARKPQLARASEAQELPVTTLLARERRVVRTHPTRRSSFPPTGVVTTGCHCKGCDDGSISSARSPKLCASVCENHGTCKMMLFDSSRPDINCFLYDKDPDKIIQKTEKTHTIYTCWQKDTEKVPLWSAAPATGKTLPPDQEIEAAFNKEMYKSGASAGTSSPSVVPTGSIDNQAAEQPLTRSPSYPPETRYEHSTFPTEHPSLDPTLTPTYAPTLVPTSPPTGAPTYDPSNTPTETPSANVVFYHDAVRIADVSSGMYAIPYKGSLPPGGGVPDYKLYMDRAFVNSTTFYIRPATNSYSGCVKFGDQIYFSLDNPAWINTVYDADNKWIDFGTTPSNFHVWPEPAAGDVPGKLGGCMQYGIAFYFGISGENQPTSAYGWFGESLAYRRSSDALVKFGPGKANACDPDNIIQGNVNTIPLWARFSLAADPAGQTAR